MKKLVVPTLFSFMIVLSSCTKERLNNDTVYVAGGTQLSASMSSEVFETKMSFSESSDDSGNLSLCSVWTESDALVLNPDASSSSSAVNFALVSGAGTKTGFFKSAAPVSSTSRTWTAYFPSTIKCDEDFENFSFDGQTQKGNDNTDHLSALNIMRKKYSYDEPQGCPTEISFSGDGFEQASCVKFVLSGFPEAVTPKKLTFEIYCYSIYFWSRLNQEVGTSTLFSQSMVFSDVAATSSLTAYMMIPPKTMALNMYHVKLSLECADGTVLTTERVMPDKETLEMTFEPGKYYTMSFKKNWVVEDGFDGTWGTFQTPSSPDIVTPYCNLIIMGDGYTREDYEGENSKFMTDAKAAYDAFFSIEPYRSLKQYFGVYYVNVVSQQKIHTTGEYLNGAMNVDNNTVFGLKFTPDATKIEGDETAALYYGEKISTLSDSQVCMSTIVVLANTYCHAGTTYLSYGWDPTDYCPDYSVAYVALGNEGPDQESDFRECLIHEAGGHGFGKLGDEYTTNKYYPNLESAQNKLLEYQSVGIYHNIFKYEPGMTVVGDTPWSDLAGISTYSGSSAIVRGRFVD